MLSGRDRICHAHAGNIKFRALIRTYRETYQKAGLRKVKCAVTTDILRAVEEAGGRFLKQDEESGLWYEMGADRRYEKVSLASRCCHTLHGVVGSLTSSFIALQVSHALRSAKAPLVESRFARAQQQTAVCERLALIATLVGARKCHASILGVQTTGYLSQNDKLCR